MFGLLRENRHRDSRGRGTNTPIFYRKMGMVLKVSNILLTFTFYQYFGFCIDRKLSLTLPLVALYTYTIFSQTICQNLQYLEKIILLSCKKVSIKK